MVSRSLLRNLGPALYVAFLLVAPFEHHDLICHLKTPQHCSACTSSQPTAAPHAPEAVGRGPFVEAGRIAAFHPGRDGRTADRLPQHL
jgi:hypothetical protein